MKHLARKLKRGFRKKPIYQLTRFPQDQFDLISEHPIYKESRSSFEIGCNFGLLVKMFNDDGRFAVGIDTTDFWKGSQPQGAILGKIELSPETIDQLPEFDMVCILSVHHQIVAKLGDEETKKLIEKLLSKARKGLFIEFAALSEKFGEPKNTLFKDNDENSVRAYARGWLESFCSSEQIDYLGKTRELEKTEPYRYLYAIKRS